jgi:[acyl-carrier-protein] S-malonyltransferase
MTKYALVFPGQGSQSRGMLNAYDDFPIVRETFIEASDILKQDLWQLVGEGSDAELNATVNTQPVMLAAGVAVYRAWKSLNAPTPSMMAGHSLGEYTALVASGALKFSDALPLVRYRAECMQLAVPEGVGGIAAISFVKCVRQPRKMKSLRRSITIPLVKLLLPGTALPLNEVWKWLKHVEQNVL